jgi:DNA-binding XRE family transcriptional regulator
MNIAPRRVVNFRQLLGLTQRQLAQAIGVTDQTISNWERGIYEPKLTLRQTANLCRLTQLSVEQLAEMFEDAQLE